MTGRWRESLTNRLDPGAKRSFARARTLRVGSRAGIIARCWAFSTVGNRGSLGSILAVVLLLMGSACGKSVHDPGPIAWHHDLASARADAGTRKKPVVLFFGAEWDMGTKKLARESFADPAVRALINREFVAAWIDATEDEDEQTKRATRQLRVIGLPTIIVLAPDFETERRRINEYATPARLLAVLRASREPR